MALAISKRDEFNDLRRTVIIEHDIGSYYFRIMNMVFKIYNQQFYQLGQIKILDDSNGKIERQRTGLKLGNIKHKFASKFSSNAYIK